MHSMDRRGKPITPPALACESNVDRVVPPVKVDLAPVSITLAGAPIRRAAFDLLPEK
jgi:hypothetical protein